MAHEKIVFSPGLGVSAGAFVEAWNGDEACRQAAEARLQAGAAAAFIDPGLADAALLVLGNIAIGLATNALYDLLKAGLQRARAQDGLPPLAADEIEIRRIPQPDGSFITIITQARKP
jgi:hypothetical protein